MSDLFVGKLRAVRPLAVLGTIGVLVAACGGTSTAGTGRAADQTLRFPSDSAIGTLDPAQINAETDVEIYQNLFDGLLKFDDKLNVVPDIATKLPDISSDGLTYTFKLNPNAKFWNGHAVKASDFIYSFSRSAAEGQDAYGGNFDRVVGYDVVSTTKDWAHNQKMLSGMGAPDDQTLMIKLTSPWGVFNTELALAAAAQVVDPTVVNQDDANWWATPATAVGTGPYKMVSYTPKQSITFDAVPNWWGSPQPTVQHVKMDFIGDMAQGVSKFEQGGYDLVGYGGMGSDISPDDILRIQKDPTLTKQLKFVNKVRTIWVQYGFGRADSVFKGDLASGPAHDLRIAFSLAIDHATFIKNYTHHQYNLFREGWQADYDHPQDWFDNLFIEGGGSNGGEFTDPMVESLVKKADAEPDINKAIPDYISANKQMMADAAYAPLVYFKGEFLFKPYLQGAGSNNFNDFYWNEMKIGSH